MADEYSKPPYNRKIHIPQDYNWQSLTSLRGAELEVHYSMLLRELESLKQDLQDFRMSRII
jgi:type I restriction enzyme M protein